MEKDKEIATETTPAPAPAQHVSCNNHQAESKKPTDWPPSDERFAAEEWPESTVKAHETEADTYRGSLLPAAVGDCCGRERLERHRVAMAGRVWIPDSWGQESFLHDWKDCKGFDAPLVHSRIMSARSALMEEGRRKSSSTPPVENSC